MNPKVSMKFSSAFLGAASLIFIAIIARIREEKIHKY